MDVRPPVPAPRQSRAAGLLPSHGSPVQGNQVTLSRREVALIRSEGSPSHENWKLKERRDSFVQDYLSDPKKLDGCAALVDLNLPLDQKYEHLKLSQVIDLNKDKEKFLRLPQGLGILEKYASNLIKAQRPPYWRSVKFTSPFVRTHVSGLTGSREILFQMGYTENVPDGVSFPEDVKEPNVQKLRDMAADLFLARYEIDQLMTQTHPYFYLTPPLLSLDSPASTSNPGSAGQLPPVIEGSSGVQEPVAPRLDQGSSCTTKSEEQEGSSVDLGTDSDSDSEYQDAEDGVPPAFPSISPDKDQEQPLGCRCQVCGDCGAGVWCNECRDTFCVGCDDKFHKHPSRLHHRRSKVLTPSHEELSPAPELPRKRPVPKPRSKVPNQTNNRPQTFPPQENVARQVTPYQSLTTVPVNQNRRREILRPPPFTSISTPVVASRPSVSASVNVEESGATPEGPPPQLPPKMRNRQVVLPPDSQGTTHSVPPVFSCPNCFHLNAGGHITCIVCKTPLPNRNVASQVSRTTLRERMSDGESRALQDLSVPNVRLSALRREETARQEPFGLHDVAAPVNPEAVSALIIQRHGDPPLSSGNGSRAANHALSPSVDGKWSCEYCTFINLQATNICQICSKTRTVTGEVQQSASESQAAENKERLSRPCRQSSVISSLVNEREQVVMEKEEAKRKFNEQLRLGVRTPKAAGFSTDRMCGSGLVPASGVSISGQMYRQELRDPVLPQLYSNQGAPLVAQSVVPEQKMFGPLSKTEVYFPDESQLIQREQEQVYIGGQQMVEWMKMAEVEGFQAEELNIATVLGSEHREGPIHWLKTVWYDLVHMVMVKATQEAQDLGNLTPEEARTSLIECTGDVSRALVHCLDERRKKLSEISQNGVYPRTECIEFLDKHDGDVQKALMALEKKSMQPMLQRVLDSCLPDDTPDEQFILTSSILGSNESHETSAFEATVTDNGQNIDRRIRVVLVEKGMKSWGRAETAVKLMDMDYPVEDAVEAARACGDVPRALRYLRQECPLCAEEKPMGQMITFLHCQDRFCRDCVSQFFSHTIKDRSIKNLTCPQCGKPDDLDSDSPAATEYFNNLDIMIRETVDKETHDLFQRKLRDRSLMKEPNFRWCQHCSSGFINEQPDGIKMTCPHCRKQSCFKCKQKWEDQHDGVSCEQFAAWKEANDPEHQAAGLAAHLKKNGIECPNCKFRYDLAKGGCMHFKCVQCPHEFCSGCYNPFKRGERCGFSASCASRGLHAHHPRDCLFFLRDFTVDTLQQLLRDNGVEYDTEPPQERLTENQERIPDDGFVDQEPLHCKVMQQNETEEGLADGECGEEVPADYAGLCKLHYQEYLVGLVNDNLIDPADVMSADDLNVVLKRGNIAQLERGQKGANEYRDALLQVVKERLPLPRLPPRRRVLGENELRQPGEEPADLLNAEDLPDLGPLAD